LAALFLRAFFLRDFLAMADSCSSHVSGDDRSRRACGVPDPRPAGTAGAPIREASPRTRLAHDWMSGADSADEKGITMAEEIRAEMVANVWKVVATAGDEIAEGDTLVILESMKMEIPVLAESDGTLTQLAVNEGDVVQEGDLIAVIG
jgi:biotin carboxyl carrier protein